VTVPGQGQEPNPQAGQEPGGATPSAQSQQPPAAGQEPQQPPAGEAFTREYVEQLRREAADYRKRATTAESKVTEHERQQLSETERLTAEVTDWKAKATDLESKYQTALIRAAVDREANKQGAIDPDAVFALMDRADLKLTDDGAVTGAEKAVKALLDAKPYLKAGDPPAQQAGVATRAVPTTPRPNAKPQSRDERIQQARQELKRTGAYAPL
jgi:hypothetical protein